MTETAKLLCFHRLLVGNSMLSNKDKETYSWQLDLPGFGIYEQAILRKSTALVSRVGGMGGAVALSLAAAGIGKIILAHEGNLRQDDLNRQILMSGHSLNKPRVDSAYKTLKNFNHDIDVITHNENINEDNVGRLLSDVDIAFGCAPLFKERFALNDGCLKKGIPLIDCSMYAMEGRVIPILINQAPCLKCIYNEPPTHWKRKFPVLAAVSSLVAQIGTIEGIKALTNFSKPSYGSMLYIDAAQYKIEKINLNAVCSECSTNN